MSNVFVSYVHADSTEANRIAEELSKRGANVHLGRDKLDPGIQWQEAIRNIISGGGDFIACFSRAYWKPKRAFLNEELAFAMNELRQCGPDKSFFIPVLLQECEIPIVDIGDDQTFLDLQLIALYDDWDEGLDNIALAISRLTKEDMMQLILENAVKLAAAYDDTKKGVSREIRSNLNAQISAKINDAAFSTGFPQLR